MKDRHGTYYARVLERLQVCCCARARSGQRAPDLSQSQRFHFV